MSRKSLPLPDNYNHFLHSLKERIQRAQVKAALAVNQELILLYWQIGGAILARQRDEGWGAKVIDRLARDLKKAFPEMKGLSRTNLLYMRAFAEAWPDEQIVQQAVGQIPWGHNIRIIDTLDDPAERLWYVQQTIENGWSRNVLMYQIDSGLYQRQGSAIANFDRTLPKPQADLARQLIKDPYSFNFLNLGREVQERELERALVQHMRDFLLELGVGFAFVGSQYTLEVEGKEFRIDLLFYHLRLRSYIAIDLKMVEFEPAFSGQMNFYIAAIDNLLRHPDDRPTIGLILCRSKRKTVVEYALQNVNTPIAVSTHRLPKQLQENLPSVEQLEMELETVASQLEAQSVEKTSEEAQE